jgi:4-hydroxy 2-oxovalerate aldolase
MKVKLLESTLSYGGYVNGWNFGLNSILMIISNLQKANLDIIDLGFITKFSLNDENLSKFNSFHSLRKFKALKNHKSMWVCSINYGEFGVEDIPEANDSLIDGIRLAFHKKEVEYAVQFSKELILKGFKVFIQPLSTSLY